MKRLLAEAEIPDLDTESGEYLELHGGRYGAGITLVREVGWGRPATPPAQESGDDDGYVLTYLYEQDRRGCRRCLQ